MDLDNRTPFPAMLFRSVVEEDMMVAAAIVRVTFEFGADGPVPSTSQPWKVRKEPIETPYGIKESDDLYYREGTDVLLLGQARPEGAGPVGQLEVRVEIGGFACSTLVFGDRRWERGAPGEFKPSVPVPFTEIPLRADRAYGGKDTWDELEVASPENPEGKGFLLEEEHVEGRSLPNLEDPAQRITRWNEIVPPAGVGFCPATSGLRLRNGLEIDEKGSILAVKPALFNEAFPRMIAPRVEGGQRVRLTGMSVAGALDFVVPSLAFTCTVAFGSRLRGEVPFSIDQIGIAPDEGRFFLSFRAPFRYKVHPHETRTCMIVPTGMA